MQDQQHRSLPPAISYSLPGILNYLQVEWRKFEKERNDWQVERSDLRVCPCLAVPLMTAILGSSCIS